MESKDLQRKYNSLVEEKQRLNLAIARTETKLESLQEENSNLEKQILEESGTKTVDEAKLKLKKLNEKLEKLLEEAEELLNE